MSRIFLLTFVLSLIAIPIANAQDEATILVLRPFCQNLDLTKCLDYDIEDPMTMKTPVLKQGQRITMNLMIKNPSEHTLQKYRSWLSFDPTVLEGMEIGFASAFPTVTPGEFTISNTEGYIKMSGTAAKGKEPQAPIINVATVSFRVKKVPKGGRTAIGFYDLKAGTDGHTYLTELDNPTVNLLPETLGSLLVLMEESATASSATAQSSVSSAESSSLHSAAQSSSAAGDRTAFALLQVQNVRITTEGSSVFLAWDALKSSDLQGYNVYYGTETGRYIQRRSVDAATASLVLRALPLDTTYYVAIRAVDKSNQESAFSQEVAVEVGDPASSTAPLRGQGTGSKPVGQNPLGNGSTTTVPGQAGPASYAILFLMASAVMGTALAFRRQIIARNLPR